MAKPKASKSVDVGKAPDEPKGALAAFDERSPDDLSFDPENPRFADLHNPTDDEIVQFHLINADLDELLRSIATTGYQPIEPLIVWQPPKTTEWLVLEGNRRLAALRLFRDDALAKRLKVDVPLLSASHRKSTDKVLVRYVNSREEARAFIGFKHVNGPNKWSALAKAKFAADWLTREPKTSIEHIARSFGDTHNTVRRLVLGWFALQQAEKNGFGRDTANTRKFFFSHLYTGLSRPSIREHVGLPTENEAVTPQPDPIPVSKIPAFRQLFSWLYGDQSLKEAALIRSQNPDLNYLSDVLADTRAKRVLIATRDLDTAYRELVPDSREFENAIVEALRRAQTAASLVGAFDGSEPLLDIADRLAKTTATLLRTMRGSGMERRDADRN